MDSAIMDFETMALLIMGPRNNGHDNNGVCNNGLCNEGLCNNLPRNIVPLENGLCNNRPRTMDTATKDPKK